MPDDIDTGGTSDAGRAVVPPPSFGPAETPPGRQSETPPKENDAELEEWIRGFIRDELLNSSASTAQEAIEKLVDDNAFLDAFIKKLTIMFGGMIREDILKQIGQDLPSIYRGIAAELDAARIPVNAAVIAALVVDEIVNRLGGADMIRESVIEKCVASTGGTEAFAKVIASQPNLVAALVANATFAQAVCASPGFASEVAKHVALPATAMPTAAPTLVSSPVSPATPAEPTREMAPDLTPSKAESESSKPKKKASIMTKVMFTLFALFFFAIICKMGYEQLVYDDAPVPTQTRTTMQPAAQAIATENPSSRPTSGDPSVRSDGIPTSWSQWASVPYKTEVRIRDLDSMRTDGDARRGQDLRCANREDSLASFRQESARRVVGTERMDYRGHGFATYGEVLEAIAAGSVTWGCAPR